MSTELIIAFAGVIIGAIGVYFARQQVFFARRGDQLSRGAQVYLGIKFHTNYPTTTFAITVKNLSSNVTLKDVSVLIGTPLEFPFWHPKHGEGIVFQGVNLPYIDPLQELKFAPFILKDGEYSYTFEDFASRYFSNVLEKQNVGTYCLHGLIPFSLRLAIRYSTNVSDRMKHTSQHYRLVPMRKTADQVGRWVLMDEREREFLDNGL